MANIIWHPKFISYHLFLINFVNSNAIQFTSVLYLFDKFLNTKKQRFVFGNISSKAYKTRAYGFLIEENNISTVVSMNWSHDNLFLNYELLFLRHSRWSVSNEQIPPGIILVYVPTPNHSLLMVAIEKYISLNFNDRGHKFSCSLFLFALLLSCGGTSLFMLSKFDVSDEFALTTWSLGLMLSSSIGSGEL